MSASVITTPSASEYSGKRYPSGVVDSVLLSQKSNGKRYSSGIIVDSAVPSSKNSLSSLPDILSRNDVSSEEYLLSSSIRSNNLKQNSRVQELTINKLRYDDVDLVGREVESGVLRSRLDRMMMTFYASQDYDASKSISQTKTIRNKELVLIKGYSGCGKSALASQLKDWSSELENGLFVQGKFEITTKTPYFGVAQAFAAICKKLEQAMESDIASKQTRAKNIGDQLVSELGSELRNAISLIPELRSILPNNYEKRMSERFDEALNFEAAQEHWMNIFRVLIRTFGTCLSPLVVVLDDLQWSDMASLSVIESLLTDKENPNPLMMVGCYRSNEVDDTHVLTRTISSLGEKTEKGAFKLTKIELGNVSLNGVNKIIMALLGIDDENITKELAQICFNRTLGNPFFLIQFLTMLESEGLVSFSLGLLKWVWDVQTVEQSTMSSKNVVALLVSRMKKLSDDIQLILQYAANLGASFKETLVEQIWSLHSSNKDSNRQGFDLQKVYDILRRDHYIEKAAIRGYNWVHDKVQEAALSLGKASDPDFQFEIGTILYNNLNEDDLEESLFDVVNLINKGRARRHVLFSQLNLRAARKARKLSAFDIAARYCSHGIALLQDEKWSPIHRELTLSLMVLGCEMELASRNVEGMERYAKEVLARDDCTTLEKFPLYLAMAYKHSTIDMQYKKELKLYLSVLENLGCPIPRSKALLTIQGLRNIRKIIRTVRRERVDHIKSLPLMTDERQRAIMAVFNQTALTAFNLKNPMLMMYVITKSYDITMKYGIGEKSGAGASGLAMVIVKVTKDYEVAMRVIQSAMKMQKRVPSRYNEASVLFYAAQGVLPWTTPLRQCDTMMSEAYRLAIKSGNIRTAMYALAQRSTYFPIQQGKPLRSTLADAYRSIDIIDEHNQHERAILSRMWCQVMGNLAGESDHPLVLRGTYFDYVGWVPPTAMAEATLKCARLVLLVFFGHYEEAADLALGMGDHYEKLFSGLFFCQFETFMRGVCLFAMARKTKKRKYRRAAERILSTIDGWVKKGNPNVQQYLCLLKAEHAALKQRHMEAKLFYNQAIVISARTGQLHIAGLANQRYGDYLLVDLEDEEDAQYRIKQAIRFYSDWGAVAVVERLRSDRRSHDENHFESRILLDQVSTNHHSRRCCFIYTIGMCHL